MQNGAFAQGLQMITNSILPLRALGVTAPPRFLSREDGFNHCETDFFGRPRFDDWAVFAGFIGLFRCSLPAPVSLEACLSRGVSATQV